MKQIWKKPEETPTLNHGSPLNKMIEGRLCETNKRRLARFKSCCFESQKWVLIYFYLARKKTLDFCCYRFYLIETFQFGFWKIPRPFIFEPGSFIRKVFLLLNSWVPLGTNVIVVKSDKFMTYFVNFN